MDVLGQAPVTYGYDANSRLIDLVQGAQAVDFEYDALGPRTLLTLPNGVSTAYGYDAASRLTELIYRNATAELGRPTYQYDSAGNRLAASGSFARTLLPDPVATATYDAANRQRQFDDKTMDFDPNGNLTSITDPSGVTTFTWDARNRLVGLAGPGAAASFTYDGFGRRASKEINGQFAEYLYDGVDIVQETVDSTPVSYLRGLNIDEPFVRDGGEHYLADALGSSVALTDGSGNVQTEYEPFGRTTATGTVSGNTFQYTARENDTPNLYYFRSTFCCSLYFGRPDTPEKRPISMRILLMIR